MSKLTFKYIEAHQVNLIYKIDIDTSDQSLWKNLLKSANPDLVEEKGMEFSKDAPSDPQEWYRLLKCVNTEEFPDSEEDWWTMSKGGFETSSELIGEDGEIIISE